jgi:hypothetical protein
MQLSKFFDTVRRVHNSVYQLFCFVVHVILISNFMALFLNPSYICLSMERERRSYLVKWSVIFYFTPSNYTTVCYSAFFFLSAGFTSYFYTVITLKCGGNLWQVNDIQCTDGWGITNETWVKCFWWYYNQSFVTWIYCSLCKLNMQFMWQHCQWDTG